MVKMTKREQKEKAVLQLIFTKVDKHDVKLFEEFLRIARLEGTSQIKVVVGNKLGEYIVTITPPSIS